MDERSEEVIKKIEKLCYICNKPIRLFCGTPKVVVSGCCVGMMWKDERYILTRSAHVRCFLHLLGLTDEEIDRKSKQRKIVDDPKLFLHESDVAKLIG